MPPSAHARAAAHPRLTSPVRPSKEIFGDGPCGSVCAFGLAGTRSACSANREALRTAAFLVIAAVRGEVGCTCGTRWCGRGDGRTRTGGWGARGGGGGGG